MTKRVLAFLLVLALVVSLVPSVVLAEEAAAPGYTVILQKAHTQTENAITVDIYLQANTAEQADVTGYDFTVVPAEGMEFTGIVDATGNDGLSCNGGTGKVSYNPQKPAIPVGTKKVLVATITIASDSVPAEVKDALTLSEITISQAESFCSDDAADAETESYLGAVTQSYATYACADHACGHGEGTWTAFATTGGQLATGNYYLTSDVALTGELTFATNAEVTICLNGFDIEAATGKFLFNLTADDAAALNICDCTATGEGKDYTSGKLLPKVKNGGAIRCAINAKSTINIFGGTIDGSKHEAAELEAPAVFINATNTFNMFGGKVENFTGRLLSDGARFGPFMFRGTKAGECVATIKNVTFVNCGTGILSAPYGGNDKEGTDAKNDKVTLVVRDVTITDSKAGARAIDINNVLGGKFKSVTIEGDCKFDAPVYLASGESVILNLGANADVNIVTEENLDEEQFNAAVKMAEGGSLTTGTLLYENAGVFVTYADGQFVFEEGHIHMDKVFKAWDKTDSLPKEGNWYLLHDVTVEGGTLNVEHELNLDLNGKTVTADGNRLYNVWLATFNLYDSSSTYDEDGNWVSGGTGKITGITRNDGAVFMLHTGAVMNMYGGTITGNSGNNGMIYVYAVERDRNYNGAVFNMYGGEFSNNTSTYYGSAISVNVPDGLTLPEGKERAKVNFYGGKIINNTAKNASGSSGYGVVRGVNYLDVTVYGGEFSGNTSATGGVFYMTGDSTLSIYGGKFTGNTASAYLKANDNGSETIQNGKGGVIYMSNTAQLTIAKNEETGTAAEFSNNSAHQGGVIYVATNTCHVDISAGAYKGNKAVAVAHKMLDGSTLEDETVSGTGGLMHMNAGTATVQDISATGHSGKGAVFSTGNSAALTVENSSFTGNSAGVAGVAFVTNTSTATFKDCTMTGNTSTSNASAIRVDGSAVLTLEDTTITGNHTNKGDEWTCGALYHTGSGQKVILKGATVIVGNTSGKNPLSADYVFQGNNNAPTVYVNELTDGARVNIYNMSADQCAAADLVKIAEGGSQTSWDCGWINYYESTGANNTSTYKDVAPKTVSYVDGVFVFGHYHNVDGKMQEYTAVTGSVLPTTAGYYYLTKNISVTNVYSSDTSKTSRAWDPVDGTTLCLNGYTITANATHAIRIDTAGTRNITIQDCVGYYDADDKYVGGGITNSNRSSRVTGRAIYFNVDGVTLNWEGGKIFNCGALNDGGGDSAGSTIYVSKNSTINFSGGAFCDNKNNDKNATVAAKAKSSCIQFNQGTLNITGGSFYNNQCISLTTGTAHGGVIRMAGGVLKIDNAKFFDNESSTRGGAIVVDRAAGAGCEITNTVFRNNTSGDNGGALYFGGTVKTLTDCTFEGNAATNKGGAVYIFNELTMSGNVFENNTATEGGAVWNSQNTTATNCIFKNNSAEKGGAIFAQDSASSDKSTTIIKAADGGTSLFEGNTATEGGAIYATTLNSKAVDVKLTNVTFKNNGNTVANEDGIPVTTNGGALFMSGTAGLSVCSGCTFEGNVATTYGGAIYSYTGKGMTVTGTTFKNNSASGRGGAVYQDAIGATEAVTTSFTDDCLFDGNYANNRGGAIYATNTTASSAKVLNLKLNNCTFKNNGTRTDSNSTGYGGAITMEKTARITECTNTAFTGNYAYYGGGIATFGSSNTISMNGATFTGNNAKQGGGMYIGYTGTSHIKNVEFVANHAGRGGAVYIRCNQHAKVNFGALNADTGVVSDGCTFTNNTADYTGGAIHAGSAAGAANLPKVFVYDSVFTGNTATNNGGAITVTSEDGQGYTTMTINGCEFTENKSYTGGALAVTSQGVVTVKNTTIQRNITEHDGAVYMEKNHVVSETETTPALTLSGKVVIADNTGDDYPVANLMFYNANLPYVAITELNAESKIGVTTNLTRYGNDRNLTMNAITLDGQFDANQCFFANNDDFQTFVDSDMKLVLVKHVADGAGYATVQEAMNATTGAFQLQCDTLETITVPDSVTKVDLNGNSISKITVAEDKTLTLIDTATNDYTSTNAGKVKITGEGKYNVYVESRDADGLRRYVVLENGDGTVSAHRVYLAITTKVLRPSNNGVGFKAIFAGSDVVAENQDKFGIEISTTRDFAEGTVLPGFFTDMTAGIEGTTTPNQKTIVVRDVLKDGEKNNLSYTATIYGRPYMVVEGETIYGAVVSTSMSALVEAALQSGDQTIVDAVNGMLDEFGMGAK